ncbi:putative DMBT1-like protein [Pelmatolapia mariae]|uniref:putative DMBT1-like protein n=1 Tax=Pelmatolapia mariae TaxID=158779 RepID=UPI002FE66A77
MPSRVVHAKDPALTHHYFTGKPPIRLVNGADRCSGRVEILHEGQWGTVCDDEWDFRDAAVVCRAMDCGPPNTAKSKTFFGEGQGAIWLDNVNCLGNETSLGHCRHRPFGVHNCGHGEDAGVICSGSLAVRLVNSTHECSGRVEVRHGEQWHTVCDMDWTLSKAQVVCETLECGRAMNVPGAAFYGRGSGPVNKSGWWVAQVNAPAEWRSSIKESGELCVMTIGK